MSSNINTLDHNIYWLITGGEAQRVYQEFAESQIAFRKAANIFCKKNGGNGVVLAKRHLEALSFDQDPGKNWVRISNKMYRPRRSTKAGKKIRDEMRAINRTTMLALTEQLFGEGAAFFHREGQSVVSAVGLRLLGDKTFVVASDSPEYKPVDGLVRVKASEYWAAVERDEELGAST